MHYAPNWIRLRLAFDKYLIYAHVLNIDSRFLYMYKFTCKHSLAHISCKICLQFTYFNNQEM